MIGAYDVETYEKKGDYFVPVLNCKKFYCGSLILEGRKTAEFFIEPQSMWQRIIELGRNCSKSKKILSRSR